MKKCPECGLLNPDNAVKCDCGQNLGFVEYFDINKEKRQDHKAILYLILLIIFILPITYFFYKHDINLKDEFAKILMNFFDFLNIDYLFGALVIAILPFFIYRKDIKNWKSISTNRKISILIFCLVFLVILLACIIRL